MFKVKVVGEREMIDQIASLGHVIRKPTLEGLKAGVELVIEQARINIMTAPISKSGYVRTGNLASSLQIFDAREEDTRIMVAAGSAVRYAKYHEWGWTTRGGQYVQGKLCFAKAIAQKRNESYELLLSRIVGAMRLTVTHGGAK